MLMPFGAVSWVGQGMGVMDGVHTWQEQKEVLGVYLSIGLNGVFECIFEIQMYSTRA